MEERTMCKREEREGMKGMRALREEVGVGSGE